LVVEMANDARGGILFVGEHRTAVEATRINAVMARRGDSLGERLSPILADQQPHVAPGFIVVESVQGMAGGDARLAAAAFVEVHLEGVLLAGRGRSGREKATIAAIAGGQLIAFMRARELLDGGELLLLGQKRIEQGAFIRR
jgi:hypothetical protein